MTQAELFNKLYGGARWDVGVSINRSNSLPLDANSIFASKDLADAYASRDAERIATACAAAGIKPFLNNAYIGQIVAVVTADTVSVYYIDNNLVLQEVGSKMVTDDRTIVLNSDNELGLHDFGAGYYAYNEDAEEGQDPYVWTEGFIAGLEPKAKLNAETGKYELAWYQPNPTTVEGLSSEINSLKQTVSTLETGVAKIPGIETALADRYTKAEVDAKIAGVLVYKGVASAVSTTTITNDTITVNGVNIIASSDNVGHVYVIDGKEYASDGSKWEELGSATDLSNYYTKGEVDSAIDADVAALKTELEGADSEIITRVSALETNSATKTELQTLSGTVTTLSNKVDDEATELDTLQGTVSTLSSKVDSEAGELDTLQGTVSTLSGTVSGHTETIKSLATKTELENAQSGLNESISTLSGTVSAQGGRITTLETLINGTEETDGLATDVANLKASVSTNAGDITTIKGQITALQNKDTELTGSITTLSGRVDTAEGNITTLQGTVGGHSELLAGLDGTATVKALIVDAKKAGTDAAAAVTALETGAVANNASAITALQNRATAIEEKDTVQDGRLTALEGQITGLTGAMHFEGVKEEVPTDVSGYEAGDVIIVGEKEYVFSNGEFVELGDASNYALKDTVYTKSETEGLVNAVDAKYEAALTWADMQ